jgi:lipid-A-disaccharide synthase
MPQSAQDTAPTIWINAGEVSGDMHAASLMRAFAGLGAPYRFTGMGGPAMAEAGFTAEFDSAELSLVGVSEVFGHLPRIFSLLRATKARLKALRPRAVVVVDAPEYNFRVARMAAKLGIPVYFFISPQVWGWRTGRVRFLAKYARRILCILPFEVDFYARHGVAADFIGHPLLDTMPLAELLRVPVVPGRVGILPGSRRREIAGLLPRFAAVARTLSERDPGLSFSLFRAPGVEPEFLRSFWPADLPVTAVTPGERYAGMRACELLLAASGTVTLESALLGTPTLVAYRVAPLSFLVGLFLIHAEYFSLPNLILGKRVFPELLQGQTEPATMARVASRLLFDKPLLAAVREELDGLRARMGAPGAARRAAEIILRDLAGGSPGTAG